MEIEMKFPGGKRVDAHWEGFVMKTDQPQGLGGEGSAPSPSDLFLASIGACAGVYALGFCQSRGISTEGLSLFQRVENDKVNGLPSLISLEIRLPKQFPEKYVAALLRAVENCKVKKTIAEGPSIRVATIPAEENTLATTVPS